MKAAVFQEPRKVVIREVEDPSPGDGEVLIRVKSAGICGTDLHIFEGEYYASYPLIPGHEFSGIVEAVGEGVVSLAPGDRVTADPNIACGACYYCRIGRGNHCLNFNALGVTMNGGFAEYVVAPERNVFKIGEMSFSEGAMIEPLSCAVFGVQRVGSELAGDVLIFGSGPMGILLMQLVKRAGAVNVVITDLKKGRLDLAQSLGADEVVVAGEGQEEKLKEIAPLGFDLVIDATGVPEVVEGMFRFAKDGGKILIFGVCPRDARISFSPYEIYKRDLTVYGSFALYQTFEPAIKLIQSQAVKVEPLISHKFPLEEFPHALELMRGPQESMKVQIELP